MPHCTRFALLSLVVVAVAAPFVAACGEISEGGDEAAPVESTESSVEQGMFDCTERADTGYTNGNAFAINVVTVDDKPLEVQTANAYIVMQQAAANDGIDLRVVSGFRTMAEQEYLYGCYVNCNCNSCNLAASPGYSNHQSGHAIDFNTADGGVLDWMNAHANDFGWTRTVPSEVWHWEWWGGGPGGGPCGADQACLDNPNFGGCNGTVITNCDENNHVGSGDCGFFGAGCSTEGGAPHCVHPYCMLNLNGGEDGSFCEDDTKIGTCALGQLSEGDCGAYGARCSEEGGNGVAAHCVHYLCWTHLPNNGEDGTFCTDAGLLATCTLGAYAEAACATGATCTGDAGTARCDDGTTPGDGTGGGTGDGSGGGTGTGDGSGGGTGDGGTTPPGGTGTGTGDGTGTGTGGGDGTGGDDTGAGGGGGGHHVTLHGTPPSKPAGSCASTDGAPVALTLAAFAFVRRRSFTSKSRRTPC